MSLRFAVELTLRRYPGLRLAGIVILLALAAWVAMGALRPHTPSGASGLPVARTAEDGHRAFRAALASHRDIEARQQDVLAMAAGHGLSAGRIDYATERSDSGRFQKFSMAFSLHGTYPALRSFLANALARHPELGIGSLNIQRLAAGDGIEAQVRLVLFADAGAGTRQ
jgi:hypothetical protein